MTQAQRRPAHTTRKVRRAKQRKALRMKDELTLTLSAQEMDKVANALGQRPYVEVAQLLQKIAQQIGDQQRQQQGPQTGPQEPNGAQEVPAPTVQ